MCKCKTLSEKILGDGCDECNPEMAMQITIDNLEDEVNDLKSKLNVSTTQDLVWITRDEIKELQTNRDKITEAEGIINELIKLKVEPSIKIAVDAIRKMDDVLPLALNSGKQIREYADKLEGVK